jgi:hypothetical protein
MAGRTTLSLAPLIILSIAVIMLGAQNPNNANYEESKVGSYTLPDPLVLKNGRRVTSPQQWPARRSELLDLFAREVYGRTPATATGMIGKLRFEIRSRQSTALEGLATRQEITVHLTNKADGPRMSLLVYLPNGATGAVPVFLGMNFNGNQSVTNEPDVAISTSWMRPDNEGRILNNRATASSRGMSVSRWPLTSILRSGYGVATVYYGDLYPDHQNGLQDSIIPHYYQSGQHAPGPDEWGAIGAWAWGLSRCLDVLEKIPGVDARQVILHGHSRLGKAALWAGAQDERFAIVISNDSGEGGAALARRNFGETLERINTAFPHWFADNFKKYSRSVDSLPVDQHQLLALVAPRPLYVASAAEDLWADPRGEFLGARGADPVYRLLRTSGLGLVEMPGIHQPVTTTIGYHLRAGKHDVTEYDWEQFIKFANIQLKRAPRRR